MCGIVGIIKDVGAEVTKSEFYDFLSMLKDAETRGRQAVGVCYIQENGKALVMKTGEQASLIIPYIRYFSGIRAILGHTRASTGGPATFNVNNHPHENKKWALIHNGIISVSAEYRSKLKLYSQCDTEYFVSSFLLEEKENKLDCNQNDFYENLFKKSFSNISGSWSLCFTRKGTEDIFLTTNGKNPLEIMKFEDGLYFASLRHYITTTEKYKEKDEAEFIVPQDNTVYMYEETEKKLKFVCEYKEREVPALGRYHSSIPDVYTEQFDDYYDNTCIGTPKTTQYTKIVPDVIWDEDLFDFFVEGVIFDVDKEEIRFGYDFSKKELMEEAIKVIKENPVLFNLSEEEFTNISDKDGIKRIRKKITDEFVIAFNDAYDIAKAIEFRGGKWGGYYYEIDLEQYLNLFPWYVRVLAIKYGFYIEKIVVKETSDEEEERMEVENALYEEENSV